MYRYKQAVPDAITWNIFLHGFVKAGQMRAAEKVRELMEFRGFRPDEVTFSSLLSGYASAQNVEKVAEMYGEVEGIAGRAEGGAGEEEGG